MAPAHLAKGRRQIIIAQAVYWEVKSTKRKAEKSRKNCIIGALQQDLKINRNSLSSTEMTDVECGRLLKFSENFFIQRYMCDKIFTKTQSVVF